MNIYFYLIRPKTDHSCSNQDYHEFEIRRYLILLLLCQSQVNEMQNRRAGSMYEGLQPLTFTGSYIVKLDLLLII